MKSAIYINEGVTQVVITPENEWEKNALKMIKNSDKVETYWGEFYECHGGWVRQPSTYHSSKESLMFRINKQIEDLPKSPESFSGL